MHFSCSNTAVPHRHLSGPLAIDSRRAAITLHETTMMPSWDDAHMPQPPKHSTDSASRGGQPTAAAVCPNDKREKGTAEPPNDSEKMTYTGKSVQRFKQEALARTLLLDKLCCDRGGATGQSGSPLRCDTTAELEPARGCGVINANDGSLPPTATAAGIAAVEGRLRQAEVS